MQTIPQTHPIYMCVCMQLSIILWGLFYSEQRHKTPKYDLLNALVDYQDTMNYQIYTGLDYKYHTAQR